MAVSSLVATVGASTSNTYCTLAEANQYHEDRPASGTAWSGATDAEKNAALLFAALQMDALFEWEGWVVDSTQAMLFPRTGLTKRNGFALATTVVPTEIKDAQAEFARQLIADVTRVDDSDIETLGITRLKAGPVDLSFKESVHAKVVPDAVANLIPRNWYVGIIGRSKGTARLVRA